MIKWDLNTKKAWAFSSAETSDGNALTVERKLGDRLGICLKGTVLAEGVVLVTEPSFQADDDDDPTTSLHAGFVWEPPFFWHDNKTGKEVPTVILSEEDAEEPHYLESQGIGPISDDPVAWVLAVRALFMDRIVNARTGASELIIPAEDRAIEIRQAFLDFTGRHSGLAKDYQLLEAFIEEYPKALKELQGGKYVDSIK